MKTHDSDDHILDFSKMKQKKQERLKARRRMLVLVIALVTVVVAIVATILFFQVREAVEDKGFWQNFNSSHGTSQQ